MSQDQKVASLKTSQPNAGSVYAAEAALWAGKSYDDRYWSLYWKHVDDVLLADTPVGYWRLNDTSGTQATDASGNARHGTYSGGFTLNQGGVYLDGASGLVTIADNAAYSIVTTHSLTVEAWIAPRVTDMANPESTGYVNFLGKGAASNNEWLFRMYQDSATDVPSRVGRLSSYDFPLTGGSGIGAYWQAPIAAHGWTHVCAVHTWDGTTSTVRFFRDGATTGTPSGQQSTAQTVADGTAAVRIGSLATTTKSWFDGLVRGVAVYSTAFTDAKVAAHYAAGVQRSRNDLEDLYYAAH